MPDQSNFDEHQERIRKTLHATERAMQDAQAAQSKVVQFLGMLQEQLTRLEGEMCEAGLLTSETGDK